MIGIWMRTARIVGRQRVRRMRNPLRIKERQTRLPPSGAREPSEEVIEAAVLHGHNNDVIDAGLVRWRERVRTGCLAREQRFRIQSGDRSQYGCTTCPGHAGQEVSS